MHQAGGEKFIGLVKDAPPRWCTVHHPLHDPPRAEPPVRPSACGTTRAPLRVRNHPCAPPRAEPPAPIAASRGPRTHPTRPHGPVRSFSRSAYAPRGPHGPVRNRSWSGHPRSRPRWTIFHAVCRSLSQDRESFDAAPPRPGKPRSPWPARRRARRGAGVARDGMVVAPRGGGARRHGESRSGRVVHAGDARPGASWPIVGRGSSEVHGRVRRRGAARHRCRRRRRDDSHPGRDAHHPSGPEDVPARTVRGARRRARPRLCAASERACRSPSFRPRRRRSRRPRRPRRPRRQAPSRRGPPTPAARRPRRRTPAGLAKRTWRWTDVRRTTAKRAWRWTDVRRTAGNRPTRRTAGQRAERRTTGRWTDVRRTIGERPGQWTAGQRAWQ